MNRTEAQQLGEQAEQQALHFLSQHGLRLVCKNYRCFLGEIDIILQEERDTIVFVEVRYRATSNYGTALESIHGQKKKRMIKTAVFFLKQQQWLDKKVCRFDVVAVHDLHSSKQCEWIKSAFTIND